MSASGVIQEIKSMDDVQKCILDIFKEVHKLCENNHITYYGISGTCLGAVRHQGFIPWDDDMDIGIPIEQFDRFLRVAKKQLPPYLKIFSPFEKVHFSHLMIKIIDTRTTFIEEPFYKYPDTWSGVWLDVIPLCGVPSGKVARNAFYSYLWYNMFMDLYLREDYMGSHLVPIQKMVKNFVVNNRNPNYYMRKQLAFIKKFPVRKYNYVLEAGFFHFRNWTSKRKYFDTRVKLPFEDTEIYVPGDYRDYLESEFGDYMVIPPVEERTVHHGTVDLNRSYLEYLEHPEWINAKDN